MEPPYAIVRRKQGDWTVTRFDSTDWHAADWRFCAGSDEARARRVAESLNRGRSAAAQTGCPGGDEPRRRIQPRRRRPRRGDGHA